MFQYSANAFKQGSQDLVTFAGRVAVVRETKGGSQHSALLLGFCFFYCI